MIVSRQPASGMPALPAAFATGRLLPPIRRREDLGWLAELRGYKVRGARLCSEAPV